tara:strand:+ start:243 stop:509 length:267 start_codon:yes stop_codon:yes gene_type:complete
MIQVYIELANIIWENDPLDNIAYEQGTSRAFYADIPTHEGVTAQDIDNAIADSLEHECGCRPESWTLYAFDDTLETFIKDSGLNYDIR